MDRRPLLIGEASNDPLGRPFRGRSGAFLASLLGLTVERFHEAFECVNLLSTWPGRLIGSKGHMFPFVEARTAAASMTLADRHVVLAGKRVASAFGLRRAKFLADASLGMGEVRCVVVPHPSGIVRWWNDPVNQELAANVLLNVLEDAVRCASER